MFSGASAGSYNTKRGEKLILRPYRFFSNHFTRSFEKCRAKKRLFLTKLLGNPVADVQYTKMPSFDYYLMAQCTALTVEGVKAASQHYLQPNNMARDGP